MPPRPPAGDLLTRAPLLVGVALLLLNDHVLKVHCPSWWTGKLSDAAGMVFFPLLLQGAWELALETLGRWRGPDVRVTAGCVVLTGAVFTLVKTNVHAAQWYQATWGVLRWPLDMVAAWWRHQPVPRAGLVQLVMDPSDLMVLPLLGLALWTGWRVSREASQAPQQAPAWVVR